MPTPDTAPYADAITAIDAFIRTLRQHCSVSNLANSIEQFLALQTALDAVARSLADRQLPPEPVRSNYLARLHTLAFELHRIQPVLLQEHSRLEHSLHTSTARRAWLDTLSRTQ